MEKVFEALERLTNHLDLDDKYFYNQEKVDEETIKQALLKAQEQDKVLEIIREYQVDIWLLLQCDYENYVRIRKEALIETYTLVKEDGNVLQDIIPEEIFYLLKEKMK